MAFFVKTVTALDAEAQLEERFQGTSDSVAWIRMSCYALGRSLLSSAPPVPLVTIGDLVLYPIWELRGRPLKSRVRKAVQTRMLTLDPAGSNAAALEEAAEILRGGGLVALPTETVYGLGVVPDNDDAVQRLYHVKDRPGGLPLTLHVSDRASVEGFIEPPSRPARLLMARYWPGPLTLVLAARASAATATIGIRLPSHELTRQLIRQVGRPILATSANPHGREPAVDAEGVKEYFDGKIEAIIDGGPVPLKQSSTVVQIEDDTYKVLREGIITHEMVHQLLVGKRIIFVCTGNSCRSPMAEGLFRKLISEKLGGSVEDLDELGYTIESAGLLAFPGGTASENAVRVMKERGIDLRQHRTRPLTVEMIQASDHIYALSQGHLDQITQSGVGVKENVSLLTEHGVPDPVGGDIEIYRQCADSIEDGIRKLLENF